MHLLTGACGLVVVAILAPFALRAAPVAETGAVAGDDIAVVVDGAQLVALAGLALGEAVIRFSALLAQGAREVRLAGANAVDSLAVVAIGAVQIALALTALRIAVVAGRSHRLA